MDSWYASADQDNSPGCIHRKNSSLFILSSLLARLDSYFDEMALSEDWILIKEFSDILHQLVSIMS